MDNQGKIPRSEAQELGLVRALQSRNFIKYETSNCSYMHEWCYWTTSIVQLLALLHLQMYNYSFVHVRVLSMTMSREKQVNTQHPAPMKSIGKVQNLHVFLWHAAFYMEGLGRSLFEMYSKEGDWVTSHRRQILISCLITVKCFPSGTLYCRESHFIVGRTVLYQN